MGVVPRSGAMVCRVVTACQRSLRRPRVATSMVHQERGSCFSFLASTEMNGVPFAMHRSPIGFDDDSVVAD